MDLQFISGDLLCRSLAELNRSCHNSVDKPAGSKEFLSVPCPQRQDCRIICQSAVPFKGQFKFAVFDDSSKGIAQEEEITVFILPDEFAVGIDLEGPAEGSGFIFHDAAQEMDTVFTVGQVYTEGMGHFARFYRA